VKEGRRRTSQLKGVCWDKSRNKWKATCKTKHLGHHTTEQDAARAYSKYLKDGIDPVKHRDASTSQFKGVYWDKGRNLWRAKCKLTYMGFHAAEKDAARAYNVEAQSIGRPLKVIPPAGDVGAGAGTGPGAGGRAAPKRAAPQTPAVKHKNTKCATPTTSVASAPSKKVKL
jgi:hypothetical protein